MKKNVFITGATSGIGKACAEKFAAAGYNIVINGRREEKLATLKKQLEADLVRRGDPSKPAFLRIQAE